MKADIKEGKKWDCLEVVKVGVDRHVLVEEDGFTESVDDTFYELKCVCGQVMRIWKRDWLSTRQIKDCGCGSAEREGSYVIFSISLTMALREQIAKYAASNGMNRSQAARDLIRTGLEVSE